MLTENQLQSLELGIQTSVDNRLLVENALEWVENNTTIQINTDNLEALQPNVRLFIIKYIDLMNLPFGITSESANGLSQSFDTTDRSEMIISLARSIFGEDAVTVGKVKFVAAQSPWE